MLAENFRSGLKWLPEKIILYVVHCSQFRNNLAGDTPVVVFGVERYWNRKWVSLICNFPLSRLVAFIAFLNVCTNLSASLSDEGWYGDTHTCRMPLSAVKTADANCGPLSMTNCSGILYDPNKLRKMEIVLSLVVSVNGNTCSHFETASTMIRNIFPMNRPESRWISCHRWLVIGQVQGCNLALGDQLWILWHDRQFFASASKSWSMLGHQTLLSLHLNYSLVTIVKFVWDSTVVLLWNDHSWSPQKTTSFQGQLQLPVKEGL